MNSEYFEYDEENKEPNYHSTLFEPEEISQTKDYDSLAFSNMDLMLHNFPSCQPSLHQNKESYTPSLFPDSSKLVEDSKEGITSLQVSKISANVKQFCDHGLSPLTPKSKKQKKQRVNRKERSYTDNFTKTITQKKRSKATNIIRISDLIQSNQTPNQVINCEIAKEKKEKRKIFKILKILKISKMIKKYKAPSLENENEYTPKKGEKLCQDTETNPTPEKPQYHFVEGKKLGQIDLKIKRKMTDKDSLIEENGFVKHFPNSTEQLEQLEQLDQLDKEKNKKLSNGQFNNYIGYVSSENIKLNFQLEDRLHHLKLLNDEY